MTKTEELRKAIAENRPWEEVRDLFLDLDEEEAEEEEQAPGTEEAKDE